MENKMSMRLTEVSDLIEVYEQYDKNAVSKQKDACVRMQCCLEVVINCSKAAFHYLGSVFEENRSSKGRIDKLKKGLAADSHGAACESALNLAKAYAEAIYDPKTGLRKVGEAKGVNIPLAITKKVTQAAVAVLDQAEKAVNKIGNFFR
jgi:hypothetical protein